MQILSRLLWLSVAATCFATALAADSYPSRPIRVVVPSGAGGANDVIGRMIAGKLSDLLGSQVVIDNRAGAGGVIGTALVARATPDGYTLLFVPASLTIQPALQKLPYDPTKSFAPIARAGSGSFVLVVTPSVPSDSLKEFIAYAKQHSGKLLFGTAGAGTTSHMFLELFKKMADVDIVPVHYKGGNQQVIDLLGGHSHGTIVSLPTVRPHVVSGKLRALGTTSSRRMVSLPDVPTLAEAGVPGYHAIVWWGFLAPAGTPSSIVDRLDQAIAAVLALDEVKSAFGTQGVDPDYQGAAQFSRFIAEEMRTWGEVVRKGNIKLE